MRDDPAVSIRHAACADAANVARFAVRTFEEALGADNRAEDVALYIAASCNERKQRLEIENPMVETLLVESDQAFAGFAQRRQGAAPSCVQETDAVELWRLYIDAPWHGRGIAHRLMRAVADAARRRRARWRWLRVWERNPRAQAFYRKCGFEIVGAQPFLLGTERQVDNVRLRAFGTPG
jgi:ribosomal protein S18 acetylase RimI-like enzyme